MTGNTGNRVREFRRRALMSAAELAEYVEITPSMVRHIETGQRNPGFKTRRRLALALNATDAELFPPALPSPQHDYGVAVFAGRCGHRWIGTVSGDYTCPVCGAHDGDHHLVSVEELPVQPQDSGTTWARVAEAAEATS